MIVATHGRAFWVLDDVSSLRQLNDAVAAGSVAGANGDYLFDPARCVSHATGESEEGTPLPLDEPQADNAATGLYVGLLSRSAFEHAGRDHDYIRGEDGRPLVERRQTPRSECEEGGRCAAMALDAAVAGDDGRRSLPLRVGLQRNLARVRTSSSGGTGKIRRYLASERENLPAVHPRAARSAHLGERRRSRRSAQHATALAIADSIAAVGAARERAQALAKKMVIPARREELEKEVIGVEGADDPDNSVGAPSRDFSSFLFLDGSLSNLFDAVESADAAPTPDMLHAYSKLLARPTRRRSAVSTLCNGCASGYSSPSKKSSDSERIRRRSGERTIHFALSG